jgi:hypothetical protein
LGKSSRPYLKITKAKKGKKAWLKGKALAY